MVKKADSPIVKLSSVKEFEFLSTGVDELDEICGLPIGLITCIYGSGHVGKTDLALRAAVSASKAGKRVLYCDVEQRLNVKRIDALGGSRELIDYSSEYVQEDVAEMIIEAVDKYDLIIVDSVAQLMPRAERDGEMGDANIGLRAKLNWKWIRILQGKLAKSNCALVLISQLRQSPNIYKPTYIAGGDNLTFNSSLILQLSSNNSGDKIIKDKEQVGRKVTAKIVKSNLGEDIAGKKRLYLNQETSFKLLF
jgi:recombination protein RecA